MSVKRNAVLLNTEAHRPARDQFVDHLNQVTRREGWRTWEAISYFLEGSFRAMRAATIKHKAEALAENEARYMRIVQRCQCPKESMADLSSMLAATVAGLEAEPIDFLGPIYSEFASSAQLGQFFTPYHLSKAMAMMIIEEPERMLADGGRGFITLQEPACGVGGMALAACEVLRERGFDLARQVHWSMIDIDFTAMAAAYIQVNLCGISADVFHGNALALDSWLSTPTLTAMLFPKRLKYDPKAALPAPTPSPPSPTKAVPRPSKPMQLSLFAEE